MSEIDLLIKIRPQIKNFAESIGEQLAKNYHKGLNGPYHDRLSKGIEIAVRAKADQLVIIINSLLDDRERRNAKTIINIPEIESVRRALILGLWSCRPVNIGKKNKVQIKSSQIYGDSSYIPPINLESD